MTGFLIGSTPRHQQIAILIDIAAQTFVARQILHVLFRQGLEPVFLPGIAVHHQMAREAFDQRARRQVGESFFFEGRRQRIESRFRIAHRHHADHPTEHHPVRPLVLARVLRPSDAAATNETAVHLDRIRPLNLDHPFRRRVSQQRISQCDHAQIERPPCRA